MYFSSNWLREKVVKCGGHTLVLGPPCGTTYDPALTFNYWEGMDGFQNANFDNNKRRRMSPPRVYVDELPLGAEAKSDYFKTTFVSNDFYNDDKDKQRSIVYSPLNDSDNYGKKAKSDNFKTTFVSNDIYNDDKDKQRSVVYSPLNLSDSDNYGKKVGVEHYSEYDDTCSNQPNVCATPPYTYEGSVSDSGLDSESDTNSISPDLPFQINSNTSVFPHSNVPFIDTHCHLDYMFTRENHMRSFSSYIKRKDFPGNFAGCITCFCDPPSLNDPKYYNEILSEPGVWGAFGLHPHNAGIFSEKILDNIITAVSHPKVVAWGEMGLDYTNGTDQVKSIQQEVFIRQIRAAVKLNKPFVIHSRHANEDAFEILKRYTPENHKIHIHCYSGTWNTAQKIIEHFPNAFFGVTGLVTYNTSQEIQLMVRNCPFDRLLMETDAPYLRPFYRVFIDRDTPKTSTPGMGIIIAEKMAELKQLSLDDVLIQLRENVQEMYGI